jgi:hypothetical protein
MITLMCTLVSVCLSSASFIGLMYFGFGIEIQNIWAFFVLFAAWKVFSNLARAFAKSVKVE